MDTKAKQFLPLLLSATLLVGMYLGYRMSKDIPDRFSSKKRQMKLEQLIELIEKRYVDSISTGELRKGGIDGILNTLDPHTVYIASEDVPRANEELDGYFYGIGMEFYKENDTVFISSIIENSPASKANLFAGDRIIKVNNHTISGKNLANEKISGLIRGRKNSKVMLETLHPDDTYEKITLTRNLITHKSVYASLLPEKDIAYIRIMMFGESTYSEFRTALDELLKKGIKTLLIDVRNNPGGYMNAATDILDELIGGHSPMLITKSRYNKDTIYAERDGLFENGNLYILINENSASASEILAGCVQDLDRGIIVGEESYGKGLVQEQFELPDKSAIRITTARYYLPSGRCIQKSYEKGRIQYHLDHFKHKSNTDSTLRKKYYTRKHRTVYDGYGISPDISASPQNEFESEPPHWILKMAHQYCYIHRNDLKKHTDVNRFFSQFELSDEWKKELNSQIVKNKIPMQQALNLLKLAIAKTLFGPKGELQIKYKQDNAIKKVLERHNHS